MLYVPTLICHLQQVSQPTAMHSLAEVVVGSFWTMLDAQELSPHSLIVYIVELESTAAAIVMMLESNVQVVCDANTIISR